MIKQKKKKVKGEGASTVDREQREGTRESAEMSQESETRVNSRVSAGVAQARREAK